jgi:hypothetical protein
VFWRHRQFGRAPQADNMLALAAGEITEADFADWLRENARKAKFE